MSTSYIFHIDFTYLFLTVGPGPQSKNKYEMHIRIYDDDSFHGFIYVSDLLYMYFIFPQTKTAR